MIQKYQHIIFILFLSILILWFDFFFSSWTYVLLDYTLISTYKLKWFFEVSIFWHIHDIANMFFWYIFFSKLFFFLITFFTWFLWYKLSTLFYDIVKIKDLYKNTFTYIFILFLFINPFFYERMITQPWVFLWIILIWYWLYFLLKNIIIQKHIQNYIYSWIFFWFSFSLMNHALFMVLLIYLLYLLFFIKSKKSFLFLILSWLIFIWINLNWIIGNFFLNTGNTLNYVNTIDQANVENFTTNSMSWLGEELTSLILYWFWWEKWNHFLLPENLNKKWFIAWFLILSIIIFWFYNLVKNKTTKKIWLFLFSLWFISYILWVWVIAKWGIISQLMYDYIPFYIWLREPHKWIWLLMLIYSIFFSIWAYYIFRYISKIFPFKYINTVFLIIIFLFLNAWTPTVIWAFHWQLFMTDYPKSYFDFRKIESKKDFNQNKYLVLPWHSYMSCNWSKRVVANIMQWFMYPLNTINSDNIEVWTLYTNSLDQKSKDIELFIKTANINLLKKYDISHIIMLETCADFKRYKDILNKLEKSDLIKIDYKSKEISSYKIQ